MTEQQFRSGQHVLVNDDGQQFEAVFVRRAEPHDGIDPAAVPGGDIRSVAWVRKPDSSEIEGYLYTDLRPTPEADVRISIGKLYEVMQDERRAATIAFAEEMRTQLGVTVDLEITEYEPGRVGLGPVEWTAIFVGTTVATNLINNLTNDLYTKAKQLLRNRRARGRTRKMGFVIYGPDGQELRRWTTDEDVDDTGEDNRKDDDEESRNT